MRNFDLAVAYDGVRKRSLEITMLPWSLEPKGPLDEFYAAHGYMPALRPGEKESDAHVHALEHWGGVPLLVVPDNTKTGVTKPCRYDPDVNPTYQNFAAHYGFGVFTGATV